MMRFNGTGLLFLVPLITWLLCCCKPAPRRYPRDYWFDTLGRTIVLTRHHWVSADTVAGKDYYWYHWNDTLPPVSQSRLLSIRSRKSRQLFLLLLKPAPSQRAHPQF
jgi:hypothetical protein